MRNGVIASLLVVAIIASAGAGYLSGNSNARVVTSVSTTTTTTVTTNAALATSSLTVTRTTTFVSTTTLSTTLVNKGVLTTNVNGSSYYADDISSDIVVQNPGYAYLRNASVTFDGVRFEVICPQGYSGCPVPSGSTTTQTVTVLAGAYKFNMTFPDGRTETTGNIIGDSTYVFALSQHRNPRAGMLIEYVDYNYHTFLLVST